jgi:hypothetical protein
MRPIRVSLFALLVTLLFSATANNAAAQETTQQDFDNLIVALDSTTVHVTALQVHEDLTADNIRLVRTSDLALEADDEVMLNQRLEMNDMAIAELRTAISENEPILGALEASQTTVEDVIAVHVADDGRATVYVKDS